MIHTEDERADIAIALRHINANRQMQAIIWQVYELSGYEHAMSTLKGWTR